MSPTVAITPTQLSAAQALLREHLSQLEATLLEARGRMMLAMDRELATLRGWMDALHDFDPTTGLHQPMEPVAAAEPAFAEAPVSGDAPETMASNILPFAAADFNSPPLPLREPDIDPALEKATMDELNAALAAAFQYVAES